MLRCCSANIFGIYIWEADLQPVFRSRHSDSTGGERHELENNDIKEEECQFVHRLHTVVDFQTYFAAELFTSTINDQCQHCRKFTPSSHYKQPCRFTNKFSHQFLQLFVMIWIFRCLFYEGQQRSSIAYGSGWISAHTVRKVLCWSYILEAASLNRSWKSMGIYGG